MKVLNILLFLLFFSLSNCDLFSTRGYEKLLSFECNSCISLDSFIQNQPRECINQSPSDFKQCFKNLHPKNQVWLRQCKNKCEKEWPFEVAKNLGIEHLEDNNNLWNSEYPLHSRGFSSCESFCFQIYYVQHFREAIQILYPKKKHLLTTNQTCISLGYCQNENENLKQKNEKVDLKKYRPAILMHGHASTAQSMEDIADWLNQDLPGIYVKNIEIGDGFLSSIFMNLNKQIENFAQQIKNDTSLQIQKSLNLLGFSQGTLITRAFIERFNNIDEIKSFNYVSLAGPQAGQFGLSILPSWLQDWIDSYLREVPYDSWLQDTFTFAQYWRDPFKPTEFLEKCIFLPDINNMKSQKSKVYKKNIESLNSMSLIYSPNDEIISPPLSGWFSYFPWNTTSECLPWKEMPSFEGNWLGIQTLFDEFKLYHNETTCLHSDHHLSKCRHYFNTYALHLFNNSALTN